MDKLLDRRIVVPGAGGMGGQVVGPTLSDSKRGLHGSAAALAGLAYHKPAYRMASVRVVTSAAMGAPASLS